MRIRVALLLILSSSGHNHQAVMHLYGPPAMLASDIVPALPLDAVTESNQVSLARLKHDVALIREQTLSATELYRFYVKMRGVSHIGLTAWRQHAWIARRRFLC